MQDGDREVIDRPGDKFLQVDFADGADRVELLFVLVESPMYEFV